MITGTLRNIEQAERILAELKQNITEIEKADTYSLLKHQNIIKNHYGFPKYCLNVRISLRKYFLNQYADIIYRVLLGTNTGIPLKTITEIMNKNQASEGDK